MRRRRTVSAKKTGRSRRNIHSFIMFYYGSAEEPCLVFQAHIDPLESIVSK